MSLIRSKCITNLLQSNYMRFVKKLLSILYLFKFMSYLFYEKFPLFAKVPIFYLLRKQRDVRNKK